MCVFQTDVKEDIKSSPKEGQVIISFIKCKMSLLINYINKRWRNDWQKEVPMMMKWKPRRRRHKHIIWRLSPITLSDLQRELEFSLSLSLSLSLSFSHHAGVLSLWILSSEVNRSFPEWQSGQIHIVTYIHSCTFCSWYLESKEREREKKKRAMMRPLTSIGDRVVMEKGGNCRKKTFALAKCSHLMCDLHYHHFIMVLVK